MFYIFITCGLTHTEFSQNSSIVTFSGIWVLHDLIHASYSLEYISQHLQAHHMPCCSSAHCRGILNSQCTWAEWYEFTVCEVMFCSELCKLCVISNIISNILTSSALPRRYHGEASYFPNSYVELPEVQRLLAHSGKLGNRRAPLLHEGQVSLHPASPLRLHTQLKKPRDSLPTEGGGVRVGFLVSDKEDKKRRKAGLSSC